jgi:hypothetical protein
MYQRTTRLIAAVLALCVISSIGCSNKDSKAPGADVNKTVFDSSEKAKPVTITDAKHLIFFRPKVGDIFRYRITMTSTATAQTEDHVYNQFPPKEAASSQNLYYLRLTVKSIRPDSAVEFSFGYDSITMKMDRDTTHILFSTNDPKMKTDQRFIAYSNLIGETFGFTINKYGDIQEIFNTTSLVAKYMKNLPDSANTAANKDKVKQLLEGNLAQSLERTLVRFPETPLAKDTNMEQTKQINLPVWQQITFPSTLHTKTTMDGFEDRGGKVLASFTTITSLSPDKMVQEDPMAKAALANLHANIKENIVVEDATGMLVHRTYNDDRGWEFTLSAKKAADKTFHRTQSSKETTTVDLLR